MFHSSNIHLCNSSDNSGDVAYSLTLRNFRDNTWQGIVTRRFQDETFTARGQQRYAVCRRRNDTGLTWVYTVLGFSHSAAYSAGYLPTLDTVLSADSHRQRETRATWTDWTGRCFTPVRRAPASMQRKLFIDEMSAPENSDVTTIQHAARYVEVQTRHEHSPSINNRCHQCRRAKTLAAHVRKDRN